ncbi:MAG: hypothetical protein E7Z91_04750 [Cyanobacteria bacterium SIG30]|nr:hypothetical protein [Cyanobacteria bacterium SIG30]
MKIRAINSNILSFGYNLQTKRSCRDNSEMYISSKLSKLYEQAVADRFINSKLDSIRKFTSK